MSYFARDNVKWPVTLRTTLLMLVAGLLQAFALAWPFEGGWYGESLGWLQYLSLAFFAGHLDRAQNNGQAFLKSWVFAWAWLMGSIWWLYISMHTYGGLASPIAALAVVLLAAGLALFYGSAGYVFHRACGQAVGGWSRASAFAASWTLAEMARGTLWTGFPWGAIGYAHTDSWLQHWAPWVGVYGLCAISAFFAMALGAERRENGRSTRTTKVALALFILALSYTWLTAPSRTFGVLQRAHQPLTVTLLQGNIPQDLKFGGGVNKALRIYREALLSNRSDLVVTPETAIPLIPEQMPDRYWAELANHFAKSPHAALIGLPLVKRDPQGQVQYSNSALGLGPQASLASTANYQYDKHHLVPFGEFVPPMFQWFVQMMNIPLGDFTRGDSTQPNWLFRGERIAPNICYEDLFGEELARRFENPEHAPTIMVNLSNIAWFGDTIAIDQHLHISRMRALELGRPMLRATNTGATAIIDEQGRVTHRLPSSVEGVLTAEVYGAHGPITPYARWVSAWGLWPLMVVALLTIGVVLLMAHAARHGQRRFGP